MNNRLKQAREYLGFTQEEMGKLCKVSGSAIAMYEKGVRVPSEAVIELICTKGGFNEMWIKHGKGSMLRSIGRDEQIAEVLGKAIKGNKARDILLRALCLLPEDAFDDFLDYIQDVATRIMDERGEND